MSQCLSSLFLGYVADIFPKTMRWFDFFFFFALSAFSGFLCLLDDSCSCGDCDDARVTVETGMAGVEWAGEGDGFF